MPRKLLFLAICVATAYSCQAGFVEEPRSVLEDTGVLVIDVQKAGIPGEADYFPKYTPPEDVTPVLDNLERLIVLAGQKDLPLFLTFELRDDGDHALADRLRRALPPGKPQYFIKSFFNATAHPEFARMVRDSGVKRLVVGGAETDVCVLQTVLGLLEMGIEVYLLRDSVFTNEFNYEPALQRMEQAGARLMLFDDLEKSALENRPVEVKTHYMTRQSETPAAVAIKPGRIAFVVMDVLKEAVDQTNHSNKEAIVQRLQQALFASYVFDVPFFTVNDRSLEEALPDGFAPVEGDVSALDRTTVSAADAAGLVEALRERGIEQVVVLGVSQDGSVYISAQDLATSGFQTFLMEDATLARGPRLEKEQRQAAYQAGVIPLTYKSFYYGMTKAADKRDWASPKWLERLRELGEKDVGLVWVYDLLPMD